MLDIIQFIVGYFLVVLLGMIINIIWALPELDHQRFNGKQFTKWFPRVLFWPLTLIGFIGYGIYLNLKEWTD